MQIRDETETRIDLPSESNESDVITITGKKASVEEAKARIEAIQKDLVRLGSKPSSCSAPEEQCVRTCIETFPVCCRRTSRRL